MCSLMQGTALLCQDVCRLTFIHLPTPAESQQCVDWHSDALIVVTHDHKVLRIAAQIFLQCGSMQSHDAKARESHEDQDSQQMLVCSCWGMGAPLKRPLSRPSTSTVMSPTAKQTLHASQIRILALLALLTSAGPLRFPSVPHSRTLWAGHRPFHHSLTFMQAIPLAAVPFQMMLQAWRLPGVQQDWVLQSRSLVLGSHQGLAGLCLTAHHRLQCLSRVLQPAQQRAKKLLICVVPHQVPGPGWRPSHYHPSLELGLYTVVLMKQQLYLVSEALSQMLQPTKMRLWRDPQQHSLQGHRPLLVPQRVAWQLWPQLPEQLLHQLQQWVAQEPAQVPEMAGLGVACRLLDCPGSRLELPRATATHLRISWAASLLCIGQAQAKFQLPSLVCLSAGRVDA